MTSGQQPVDRLASKPPPDTPVPPSVREFAGDRRIEPVWRNQLGGLTFAVGTGDGAVYAKWARHDSGLDLAGEAERLDWAGRYIAVPRVVELHEGAEASILVTEAMAGDNAVSERWKRSPEIAARAIGIQLRRVHDALPVDECPYEWTVESRLTTAGEAADTLGTPPPIDRLVVCHGDACAPNTLMGGDGQPTGIVDLGSLGVADRWADIAVATWSTEWNYGSGWEQPLLDGYGIEPDPERTAYYRELWDAT